MALPDGQPSETPDPEAEIRQIRRELAILRLRRRNARRVALASQALMRPFEVVAAEFIVVAALVALGIAYFKGVYVALAFAVVVIGGAFLTKRGFHLWNVVVARRGLKETGRIRAYPDLEHAPGGPLDDQIRELQHRLRLLKQGVGRTPPSRRPNGR